MSEGIRATIEFPRPPKCTVAEVSADADSIVDDVWRSVPPDDAAGVTEFFVEAEEPPATEGPDHLMSIGDRHLYRLTHDGGVSCPCECLGQFGCAAQRYVAQAGTLRLVFNAEDFEELQTAVDALRDMFPDLDVKRLVRAPDATESEDPVFVDRGKLTDRQFEVLQTAYRMGYFRRPREANATEVAEELGINPSTFNEHLVIAERKLLGDVLEDGA